MSNQAAFIKSRYAQLEVADVPLEKPGPHEVLIKNHAVSINPVDSKIQALGALIEEYPAVLGFEVAGEIKEVGDEVTRFKTSDRVVALTVFIRTKETAHAGFQLYTIVPEFIVAPIPESVAYTSAVVLPLGLASAIVGLFDPKYLGLPAPSVTVNAKDERKAILVWGGSSAVGSCAIQMAAAAGLTVITTASKKNHGYVRDLGASYVFDYADVDIVDKMVVAASHLTIIGAYDVISDGDTRDISAEFLHRCGGGTLLMTRDGEVSNKALNVKASTVHPHGNLAERPEWLRVWDEFLSEGIKTGKLKMKPNPLIIRGGLGRIQHAINVCRQGVSARKVVVEF